MVLRKKKIAVHQQLQPGRGVRLCERRSSVTPRSVEEDRRCVGSVIFSYMCIYIYKQWNGTTEVALLKLLVHHNHQSHFTEPSTGDGTASVATTAGKILC